MNNPELANLDEEQIKQALTNAALSANKEQRAVMGVEEELSKGHMQLLHLAELNSHLNKRKE